MGGRVNGLVPGPALKRALPSKSAVAQIPARATPTRWRQVPIKPPEDLPPFLLA